MTTTTWINTAGGNFDTAANWNNGVPSSFGDTALITATGTYTVTVSQADVVGTLQMAKGATLDIHPTWSLDVAAGTGTGKGTLAGTVNVGNLGELDLGTDAANTTFNNTGAIDLQSTGDPTDIFIAGSVTLTGKGKLTLGDDLENKIVSDGSPATLTNNGNTISGGGTIGDADLTVVNQAKSVIDGDGVNNTMLFEAPLTNDGTVEGTTKAGLAISRATTNSGLLEALGTNANLEILAATVTNTTTKAVIQASGTGAVVGLGGATIVGGTLKTTGTNAAIGVVGTTTLDGSGAGNPVTIEGTVVVDDTGDLTLKGAIDNNGAIDLASTGDTTDLAISGMVTLNGKGKINLLSNSQIVSDGSAATLTNNGNTISGAGTIGDFFDPLLGFTNGVKGVVDANDAAGLSFGTDGVGVTNNGLMEASGSGILTFYDSVTQGTTGKLEAASAGSEIVLQGVTITGGAVSVAKGATLNAAGGGTIVNTKPLVNAGTIKVANRSDLTIEGPVTNSGVLTVHGTGIGGSTLEIVGNVTGKGNATIDERSTLKFDGASSANVTFEGGGGNTLDLVDPLKFTGTVAGMSPGDGNAIDLENIAFADGPVVSPLSTKGVLTVTDPDTHVVDKITIVGGGTFTASLATDGSTLITDPSPNPTSVPHANTNLLAQSIASFGASSGIAGSGTGHVADHHTSANFLAINSQHG